MKKILFFTITLIATSLNAMSNTAPQQLVMRLVVASALAQQVMAEKSSGVPLSLNDLNPEETVERCCCCCCTFLATTTLLMMKPHNQ